MIRTGDEYRASLQDGREVWIAGERVEDVTAHPMFRPLVDIRARIYDMAHDPSTAEVMTYSDDEIGETCAVGLKLPHTQRDWHLKRAATDAVMDDIAGVVTRVGDETVGEMWSLYDGKDVLNEVDARFGENIDRHIKEVIRLDRFHVSANTDPKGDRSKAPQDQDPDFLLHLVRETDNGIVVRGAKYETAAAYANQAFVKPTIANWGRGGDEATTRSASSSRWAPGPEAPLPDGVRRPRAGRRLPAGEPVRRGRHAADLRRRRDPVGEHPLLPPHAGRPAHPRDAAPLLRVRLRAAEPARGRPADRRGAPTTSRQTGLEHQQAVQEKLAQLACYREGINAHLTAAIATAEPSPGGLLMPNQSLLYCGRVFACSQLHQMLHLARELCGGQICVTPDVAMFDAAGPGPWLDKFYSINDTWQADDRRRLLAFARDLVNSDYAGHRLTFQLFAQAPPFAHLNAVYRSFDWDGPLAMVKDAAGLSDRVLGPTSVPAASGGPR